jgi:hypothetical protein
MELKWTYPKFKYGFNPPAIYRIDFDNGFYYIGSSMIVKTRWNTWRTNLKRDVFQSKLIADSVKGATAVTFSILEFSPDIDDEKKLKERETYYLRSHFDDPLFLNMSPNAFDSTGLKPIPEHLKRPQKPKPKRKNIKGGKFKPPTDYAYAFSKGVVQFDIQGNYIQSHKSISDAAKSVGVIDSTIQGHLKSKRKRGVRGYVFKLCGDNTPIVIQKSNPYIPHPLATPNGCKPVVDTNTGIFYDSAKEAVKQTNFKLKQFYKMLSGTIPNTSQYRYA